MLDDSDKGIYPKRFVFCEYFIESINPSALLAVNWLSSSNIPH